MAVENEENYQILEKVANESQRLGFNLMVVDLTGMGVSFYLKTWAKNQGVDYVVEAPDEGNGTVVVDMPENNWSEWEKIYRRASRDRKLIMVVSVTRLGDEGEAKKWVMGHVYKTVFVGTCSKSDIELLAERLGMKFGLKEIDNVYRLSGGIPKLAKWLLINKEHGGEGLEQIALPILEEARRAREEDLEKLGVVKSGKYVSTILADLDKKMPDGLKIEVKFDLGLVEDDKPSGVKVTKDEKKIIMEMLASGGMITREKIAEIKWGEGSYDKFSDQAINMAMRRLNKKFKRYRVKTIPRVGYQLEMDK